MRAGSEPADLAVAFFASTVNPKQTQLAMLVDRLGVPATALANDNDGEGFAIGVAKIEKTGRRFEFVEDGSNAVVIVARDEAGEPADLVAWLPNEGWFGAWFDALPLLGMHDLFAPRLGEPLPVFLDILDWFRAGRAGVVILDRKHAWRALEGVTVAAANIDDGIALRSILETPKPKIVVRASADTRIAA